MKPEPQQNGDWWYWTTRDWFNLDHDFGLKLPMVPNFGPFQTDRVQLSPVMYQTREAAIEAARAAWLQLPVDLRREIADTDPELLTHLGLERP